MNKEEEEYKEKLKKEIIKMNFIGLVILFFGGGVLIFFATEGDIKLTFLLTILTSVMYSLLMHFDYKRTWEK